MCQLATFVKMSRLVMDTFCGLKKNKKKTYITPGSNAYTEITWRNHYRIINYTDLPKKLTKAVASTSVTDFKIIFYSVWH